MGANSSKGSYAPTASGEEDAVAPNFECNVCCEHYFENDGIHTCPEHFYCNGCAVDVLHRSMKNTIDEFPPSCCARTREYGIPILVFEHLVDSEFRARYHTRLHEHVTPPAKRVYCANPECAKFLCAYEVSSDDIAVATCDTCKTPTCMKCKHKHEVGRVCGKQVSTPQLTSMPAYSKTSRIKQCPKCSTLIELRQSCNHMTCAHCKHGFCFICRLPWHGFHDAQSVILHEGRTSSGPRVGGGCPIFDDPPVGYDEEGYELNKRGLHVRTGLNRNGCDRIEIQRRADEGPARFKAEYQSRVAANQALLQAEEEARQRASTVGRMARAEVRLAAFDAELEARLAEVTAARAVAVPEASPSSRVVNKQNNQDFQLNLN
jgi:hypothetical protein